MKLTARERIMLIVLGAVAVIALSYYFICKPQLSKLEALAKEREKYRVEVQRVKTEISPDNKIHRDYEAMNNKIAEKTVRFFPDILEDKILVTLDDRIVKSQLQSDNAEFSRLEKKPVEVKAETASLIFPMGDLVAEFRKTDGGIPQKEAPKKAEAPKKTENKAASQGQPNAVNKMSVTLQFKGKYDQLKSFISSIESLNRTVAVTNLAAASGGDGLLTGTIALDFYALPKIHDQDKDYFDWPYKNQYGKADPFGR